MLFCLQEIKKYAVLKLLFPCPGLCADFVSKLVQQFYELSGTEAWKKKK